MVVRSAADKCPTLTNMLVIIVGGIPIAMPTVLSVTLALGAFKLAKEGAIVARMSAVEEMAGQSHAAVIRLVTISGPLPSRLFKLVLSSGCCLHHESVVLSWSESAVMLHCCCVQQLFALHGASPLHCLYWLY